MDPRERFDQVIAKGIRDAALVRSSLDLAEGVADHFGAMIEQYLHNYHSAAIPPQLVTFYTELSSRMVLYGLFTHFICFGSDNRSKFPGIDQRQLYERWEAMAIRALSTLQSYSKDNQGFPDAVFRELYTLEAEAALRNSGVSWWKRSRIESAIRDRFATGVALGMAIDMATAKS